MCIRSLSSASSEINYILGGYEDGSLVLWDERNPTNLLHSCQLFSQPGILCVVGLVSHTI